MNKVDLMIFDLDGTLVDSASDLISAVNYTRGVLGLPAMNDNEIISFVGDGTDKLVERLLGQELQHCRDEATEVFVSYYGAHLLDNITLYPDVRDILEFYRLKKKIIITNKRYHFTRKVTDSFEITGCFDDIIGVGSTPFRKPDARILLPLLERLGIDPAFAVIFGDGVNDINLAKNSGIKSCALLNGFTPRNILLSLKPDFACEYLRELKTMFC
ncbi:MAG TPA: HAD-IA family hydrolase [Syntrophales bacterium]|nr:HAD-IA family hydrolase [Syntrophales bacterium]